MKASAVIKKNHQVKFKQFAVLRPKPETKRNWLKRISPFLLLVVVTVFFKFPYMLITENAKAIHIILLIVLITYLVFADFFIWNFFNGRKKLLIWIIESIISSLIIYWLI